MSGHRISKTVNGTTTEYFYDGDQLVAQQSGNDRITFMFDAQGSAFGFYYNNAPSFFIKNIQGDVTAITNFAGTVVGTYTYDAWGNLIPEASDLSDEVAAMNPIRNRGYYYDAETGYYFLNSRYYDAEMMNMAKKYNKEKHKSLIYFILIQLIICGSCFLLYDAAKIATKNNTQAEIFYADSIEVTRKPIGDNRRKVIVWHDSNAYIYFFSNDIIKDETILKSLRTQQLTIRYLPKNGVIVDICGEKNTFYTMDFYNEARSGERFMIICSFIIIEIVYAIVLFFFALTTPHGYKLFCRILNRRG